jgi:integrase
MRQRLPREVLNQESWVFGQRRDPGRPLWDSSVREALHEAAKAVGCDFEGFRPHSFRRANITWRQQVGASSIEASTIAGHADIHMTADYTFVDMVRQSETPRAIQERLGKALEDEGRSLASNHRGTEVPTAAATSRDESSTLERTPVASHLVQ